jgi:pimeloyl-ACP methyl ester carboxylesterase
MTQTIFHTLLSVLFCKSSFVGIALCAAKLVLEPLQTVATLEGQVRELRGVPEENGTLLVTLIGFSWGAILSFIFTARHPQFAKKLIFIGSGPYEEKYAANVMRK